MTDHYNDPARDDLTRAVHQDIADTAKLRPSLMLAKLVLILTAVLFTATVWIEWSGISFALDQLFPPLSDGSGEVDTTGIMKLVSVFGIVTGEILLSKKMSDGMSPRQRRWLMRVGLVALALFIIGAMALMPISTLQANTMSEGEDGSGLLSQLGYLSYALMLAALLPLSVLANLLLIDMGKAALAKLDQAKALDERIASLRGLLARHDATSAELEQVERDEAALPTDDGVADLYAAQASAEIGTVAGEVLGLITAREAAEQGEPGRFKPTPVDLWNHLPVEKLRAWFDHLSSYSPARIRQIVKEA